MSPLGRWADTLAQIPKTRRQCVFSIMQYKLGTNQTRNRGKLYDCRMWCDPQMANDASVLGRDLTQKLGFRDCTAKFTKLRQISSGQLRGNFFFKRTKDGQGFKEIVQNYWTQEFVYNLGEPEYPLMHRENMQTPHSEAEVLTIAAPCHPPRQHYVKIMSITPKIQESFIWPSCGFTVWVKNRQ